MRSKSILILALLLFPLGKGTFSQTDVSNAQAIFIYNFLSHIKWPDAQLGDSYTIGIYGKTNTTKYLKTYTAQRKVGNKPIKVVEYYSPDEIKDCEVLLVAFGKTKEISKINSQLSNSACLIIGEREGAIEQGAAINFKIVGGKLKYKIDKAKAEAHNLYVSAALIHMSI